MSNTVLKLEACVAFLTLIIAVVAIGGRDTALAQGLAAISIIFMVVHAVVGLGRREALAFVVARLVVTLLVENIGAATGFPFGRVWFAPAGFETRAGLFLSLTTGVGLHYASSC